ncbi:hypothetical protein V6Z90_002848 [Aspergillus fumigatus]
MLRGSATSGPKRIINDQLRLLSVNTDNRDFQQFTQKLFLFPSTRSPHSDVVLLLVSVRPGNRAPLPSSALSDTQIVRAQDHQLLPLIHSNFGPDTPGVQYYFHGGLTE